MGFPQRDVNVASIKDGVATRLIEKQKSLSFRDDFWEYQQQD